MSGRAKKSAFWAIYGVYLPRYLRRKSLFFLLCKSGGIGRLHIPVLFCLSLLAKAAPLQTSPKVAQAAIFPARLSSTKCHHLSGLNEAVFAREAHFDSNTTVNIKRAKRVIKRQGRRKSLAILRQSRWIAHPANCIQRKCASSIRCCHALVRKEFYGARNFKVDARNFFIPI